MFDKPPRPKPRPGSLPMEKGQTAEATLPQWMQDQIDALRKAVPPFLQGEDTANSQATAKRAQGSFAKLKTARKKVEELSVSVRDEGFDDWVRRYLVTADQPSEWTQSRTLYENYIKRAKDFGNNRADKALSKQELATETQWGKMMGSLFTKKRRGKGWFYPMRLKQGA